MKLITAFENIPKFEIFKKPKPTAHFGCQFVSEIIENMVDNNINGIGKNCDALAEQKTLFSIKKNVEQIRIHFI